MKKTLLLTTLLVILSTTAFAKYKVSPYIAAGGYGTLTEAGGCVEVGVSLPIYKFISGNVFCEAYAPSFKSITAYYGLRGAARLFNTKLQSSKLYCQGTLNLLYDKTFYYSFGYSHSFNLSKHFSSQLVPYFSSNTNKAFTDGTFGLVLFFTYSF